MHEDASHFGNNNNADLSLPLFAELCTVPCKQAERTVCFDLAADGGQVNDSFVNVSSSFCENRLADAQSSQVNRTADAMPSRVDFLSQRFAA